MLIYTVVVAFYTILGQVRLKSPQDDVSMGAAEVIRVSISPASLIGALRWLLQEFRHRVYRRVYLSYWPRLRKGWKWSRGI